MSYHITCTIAHINKNKNKRLFHHTNPVIYMFNKLHTYFAYLTTAHLHTWLLEYMVHLAKGNQTRP